jgi:hypothetical protein
MPKVAAVLRANLNPPQAALTPRGPLAATNKALPNLHFFALMHQSAFSDEECTQLPQDEIFAANSGP